jgi:hypothetical protein
MVDKVVAEIKGTARVIAGDDATFLGVSLQASPSPRGRHCRRLPTAAFGVLPSHRLCCHSDLAGSTVRETPSEK